MNKFATIILFILLLLGKSGAVSAQHLVVSTSIEADVENQMQVLTEAYKRIGISIEFRRLPVERSIQMANSGEFDGELLREKGVEKDYPNLIRVPFPIKKDDFVVVTKDKKFVVQGWKSLVPYKIGYVRGVKAVEMNLAEGTNAEAASKAEHVYKKLLAGRTDVVIDGRKQAQSHFKTFGLKDLVVLEPPLLSVQLFHYLHVKNQKLVKPLTKSLQQMESEGVIQ